MIHDLLSIWFPQCCWGCQQLLAKKQKWLCVGCQAQLPRTYFEKDSQNNPLAIFLKESLPIESAFAPFYFHQQTPIQVLLHALKYKGKKKIADWLAGQSCTLLSKTNPIYSCDAVVPVPLHYKRQQKRGYNQVTRFGQYWANHIGAEYRDDLLIRHSQTKTLVRMSREQRWKEVEHAFAVQAKEKFHHLLLVDDVITTGATLTACGHALLEKVSEKISVLGMAYAQNILP